MDDKDNNLDGYLFLVVLMAFLYAVWSGDWGPFLLLLVAITIWLALRD